MRFSGLILIIKLYLSVFISDILIEIVSIHVFVLCLCMYKWNISIMKIALFYGFELNTYMIICRGKANTHLSPKIVVKLLLYSSSKLVQIVDWKINYKKKSKREKDLSQIHWFLFRKTDSKDLMVCLQSLKMEFFLTQSVPRINHLGNNYFSIKPWHSDFSF